jgi:hypothetical protein
VGGMLEQAWPGPWSGFHYGSMVVCDETDNDVLMRNETRTNVPGHTSSCQKSHSALRCRVLTHP